MCWLSFFGHGEGCLTADCRLLREGIVWQVAKLEMRPHAVIAAHKLAGDVSHGLGVVGVVALPDSLCLEDQEEALHHRVEAPHEQVVRDGLRVAAVCGMTNLRCERARSLLSRIKRRTR